MQKRRHAVFSKKNSEHLGNNVRYTCCDHNSHEVHENTERAQASRHVEREKITGTVPRTKSHSTRNNPEHDGAACGVLDSSLTTGWNVTTQQPTRSPWRFTISLVVVIHVIIHALENCISESPRSNCSGRVRKSIFIFPREVRTQVSKSSARLKKKIRICNKRMTS